MQSQSRSAPERSSAVAGRQTYAHASAVCASSAMESFWPETSEHSLHVPAFRKAVSEDPLRILIVADVNISVQLAALLHSIGRFETRMACSADTALRMARCFLPGIALISTDLPVLASYRLASALRWDSTLPALRLIALTDDIPASDRGRMLAAGFEQYLSLPVQSAALESALLPRAGHQDRTDFRAMRRMRAR